MNDFTLMAKILAAIKQCEHDRCMNVALFDVRVLKTDEATRDSLIVKLQKDGYVEGFDIIEGIDNQPYPYVMMNDSNPTITIKGLSFIEESKPLKKAFKAITGVALNVATNKLSNMLLMM